MKAEAVILHNPIVVTNRSKINCINSAFALHLVGEGRLISTVAKCDCSICTSSYSITLESSTFEAAEVEVYALRGVNMALITLSVSVCGSCENCNC